MARDCVELVQITDTLDLHRHALMSQAKLLRLAGPPEDAGAALQGAIPVAELKATSSAIRRSTETLRDVGTPAA